ncbi:HK97 family phage prohead protease [Methylobacterium sp. NEAU 140]|uniref:HK97 family phage prohead protease n=1 Tax=Methylobacterium sp. NEAU 140 TaxID=3064945 RepID=UPI002736A059|nr:HK97 family phage prohead protease [Methylobacterium sp. NEAU 140]MDP4022338.1 HK97 family phage prohead protease [Methylobacterium sp. NEAU 140]
MQVKRRAFPLAIKSVSDGGAFSGYVSIFGTPDTYREVVAPGAFKASLAATKAANRKLPICWQHDLREPIGHWDVLQEDEKGLYGEGILWTAEAPYARIAQRGMASGALSGLSIGYFVQDDAFDEVQRIRTLKTLDLREASIVTDPAHDDARVDVVKAKLAAGERVTEREFESALREKGFSRSAAEEIASLGFKAWDRRESDRPQADPADARALVERLSSFALPK